MILIDTIYFSAGSEGQQCCYNEEGIIVTGQLAGGSIDKVSPLVDFNMHIISDLLPYSFCCRGGSKCDNYYQLRPFTNDEAPPYRPIIPGSYVY